MADIIRTGDFWMDHALKEILDSYGDSCRVKGKSLLKFGVNPSLDIADGTATVWSNGPDQSNESYVTSNAIDTISSSNASDTEIMVLEGHYEDSNNDWIFHVQTVTLNGQNKIVLDQPLIRSSRLYVQDETALLGDVYVYEDTTISGGVPTDKSTVHLKASAGDNQSQKAATSLSSVDYGIITEIYWGVGRQVTASVNFNLQIQQFEKIFRTRLPVSGNSNSGTIWTSVRPHIIITPKADIRWAASTSANNTTVFAGFNGVIAIKRSAE